MIGKATKDTNFDNYWSCACVKWNRKRQPVAIKLNPLSLKRCRVCGITKEDSDKAGETNPQTKP